MPMSPSADAKDRTVEPQLVVLAGLLLCEILVFGVLGRNFFTWTNLVEVPRLSVELGLVSLALTLVIVTGGIDLSVGSLLGLSAILFGKLWRDFGFSPAAAAVATLGIGALAGGLNALFITRLRIPPLIVTLGSFSLFRGLAEGITGGVDNFTDFPESFLRLGQGYVGSLPVQLPIFALAAAGFWLLLHRAAIGRELSAIGYSAEGARHAGVRVERRIATVYILSGCAAALAAIIYVARVGQAKADAGTGYELAAITAVVLGGTSIFGGRASVAGTLLGLAAIAVLHNGLRLADLPAEMAGVFTGLMLLVAIGLDRRSSATQLTTRVTATHDGSIKEGFSMRNTQLAVLCGVILIAASMIAGGNFLLIRSLHRELGGQRTGSQTRSPDTSDSGATLRSDVRPITVAMMPKSKGNAYFIACRQGAEEAARELGVTLLWDGPTDPDPAKQNEVVDTWLTRGVDCIAVAVENREGLSSVLRKAQAKGIKVITWDSDAEPDARSFFVNQATPEGIANTLMDKAADVMGGEGQFAIITATLTASNQNEWLKHIEARRRGKYPRIEKVAVRPCDDLQAKAFDEANVILNAHPAVKLIMAICSPAVPGSAEAVKQSGRDDVKVVGLGLPNDNKPYVHAGITEAVILWNTMDLGYLTVHTAKAVSEGKLAPGAKEFAAGRLGTVEIKDDHVLLGVPFTFTKENIDKFDF
jgi:rhamnose transport system permease protein